MHAYERVLQSGVEDLGYARRITRLRAFQFDNAREVGPYLPSVPPAERRRSHLTVDDGWVDYRTTVLDHHVPRDLDQSRFEVDLDDAGVRCKLPTSTSRCPRQDSNLRPTA